MEIIAKDNLNIANLMQTLENLLLLKYSTEFFDIKVIIKIGSLIQFICCLKTGPCVK